jgi:hypothetical protein
MPVAVRSGAAWPLGINPNMDAKITEIEKMLGFIAIPLFGRDINCDSDGQSATVLDTND